MSVSLKVKAAEARNKHQNSISYSNAIETINGVTYINLAHLTDPVWKGLSDRQIAAACSANFINRVLKPINSRVNQRKDGDDSQHLTPVSTAVLGAVEKTFGFESVYKAQNVAGTGIRFRGVRCVPEVMDFAVNRFKAYMAVAEDQG